MTIVTDVRNVYTTLYKDCAKTGCIQKTVTIRGQEGKKIRISSIGCSLAAAFGVTATAWITLDGKAEALATWEEGKTSYQQKSKAVDIFVGAGKDVILRWRLKTSGTAKALMKLCTYTYSYEDVVTDPVVDPGKPPVEEEMPVGTPARIQIICTSEQDAMNLSEDLKAHIGGRVIEIYLKV